MRPWIGRLAPYGQGVLNMLSCRLRCLLAPALFLGTALIATPAPVAARSASRSGSTERLRKAQSRALFTQAEARYHAGQFGEALDLYAKAYEVLPLPGFLFNIGQCHRSLGSHNRAVLYYKGYLRTSHKAANRDLVERLITLSEAALKAEQDADRAKKREADRSARAAATLGAAEAAAQRSAEIAEAEAIVRPERAHRQEPGSQAKGVPVYRRWWFWTSIAVGLVAAVATGVGVGIGTRDEPHLPSGSLGTIDAR